ncbi:uncharacterized protein [Aquarana catesbeiana]|uniref:uncharacterized protein n=1 Tax=Aquarana catesbeiana TaxID=8400 RepID=UPI003CC932CC
MAENIGNAELKTFTGQTNIQYHYVLGRFLSHAKVFSILHDNKKQKERMYTYLKNVKLHHFEHMQVPIPVYNVKHVTTKRALDGILDEEGFRIIYNTERRKSGLILEERPEFQDLLYWSVDITSEDLENLRKQAYGNVSNGIIPEDDIKFSELREQFGNSPAFWESVSPYGNFKFSFPLCDLLSWYKDQHCGGREPQMKILGTELYRKKIAHYIVVHSPDTDKFDDFNKVPTVHRSSDPLPFVYRMDGTLYWRPESTSDKLKVIVTEDGVVRKECYERCDDFISEGTCFHTESDYPIFSVWNYLVLAFHLPNSHLKIPKELLIKNLTACAADENNYLKRDPLHKEKAEKIIKELGEKV